MIAPCAPGFPPFPDALGGRDRGSGEPPVAPPPTFCYKPVCKLRAGSQVDYDQDVIERVPPEADESPGDELVPQLPVATEALSKLISRDPSELGFPPMLAFEIALQHQPIAEICAEYDISRARWEQIKVLPSFVTALREALRLVKVEGVGFRVKARVQAEMLLKTAWIMIHAADTPPAVKADLIKWTGKMADYEPKQNAPAFGQAFSINFHMG